MKLVVQLGADAVCTQDDDGITVVPAVDITYVVSFKDALTLARYAYIEAARRGLEQAAEVIVLGDRAEWIWNRIARFCDRPVEIVDSYRPANTFGALARHFRARERRQLKSR